jgi:hypothetical protein
MKLIEDNYYIVTTFANIIKSKYKGIVFNKYTEKFNLLFRPEDSEDIQQVSLDVIEKIEPLAPKH